MWLEALAHALMVLFKPATCPADMRRVSGVHYEQVQRVCTVLDRRRCYAFQPNLVLLEPRVTHVDVCMDRYEWPNRQSQRPHVMMSFVEAEAACVSVGKRLCSEFEWELACEGPDQRPWPYGWTRTSACHNDQPFRAYDEAKVNSSDRHVRNTEVARLWQGAVSGASPGCESVFGVRDLVGNVEEWVTTSRPEWPYRSSLKGGYWSKPWYGCRGTNDSHSPGFRYYQIGFRCCRKP